MRWRRTGCQKLSLVRRGWVRSCCSSQIRMQQESAAMNRQAWPTFLARVRNLCLRVQSGRDLLMMVTPCTEIIYEIGGQLMGYPLRVRWVCSFQVIARLQGFSQRLCRAYGCEV